MTDIYHITHIDNLPGILADGMLWCDNGRRERGSANTNIGHQHIKERRARRSVDVAVGGHLADYVPFYFAPRSPMLYAIHCSKVAGYNGGQNPIVHLVSSVETIIQSGKTICFTDRHADLALAEFYDDPNQLTNVVNWEVMKSRYWSNSQDQKEKRQAEFLVHGSLEWTFIQKIGVISATVTKQINAILTSASHKPSVTVHPDWYY